MIQRRRVAQTHHEWLSLVDVSGAFLSEPVLLEVFPQGIPVLDVPTTRVDRSMGDVHPAGNPHYSLDPGMAPAVTGTILEGLARMAPPHRAIFERNRQEFLSRLALAMTRWSASMAPFKGAKVVVYHPLWSYLLTRFGLVQAGTVEDRPGIPPTPGHLTKLITLMKEEGVKLVIVEPWSDQKLAERLAREAGVKAVILATAVGSVKGATSYIDAVDYNVNALAQALR